MKGLLQFEGAFIGLSIAIVLGGTGCATSSDLGKLSRGLTQKLETLDNTVQTQVESLRADLQTTQAASTQQYEELQQTLEGVKSEMATASMLKTYSTDAIRGIKKVVDWTEQAKAQLASLRQLRAAVDQLPSLVSGLSTEMRSLRKILLTTYRLEEAALRERLKALNKMRRELEASPDGRRSGTLAAQ